MKIQKHYTLVPLGHSSIQQNVFRARQVERPAPEHTKAFRYVLPILKKVIIKPVIIPLKQLSREFGVNRYLLIFGLEFTLVGIMVFIGSVLRS